jgi:Dpy-30 motif
MVKERPPNPIEYLASYLLKHDPQRITDTATAPAVGSVSTNAPLPLPPQQGSR